jgi:hypothetical protein
MHVSLCAAAERGRSAVRDGRRIDQASIEECSQREIRQFANLKTFFS